MLRQLFLLFLPLEDDTNLSDLRFQLVIRISSLLLVGSGVALWLVLIQTVYSVPLSILLASLVVLCVAVQVLVRRSLQWGRQLLVWGPAAILLGAMAFSDQPLIPFCTVFVTLISGLLAPISGLVVTGLIVIIASLLASAGLRTYDLVQLWTAIALNVALVTLITRTFYMALQWYQVMHTRGNTLLEESREQRAELARLLKSLELAVNAERAARQQLVRANQEAEQARRLKEQFAANISHEFRTPLNLILGFSEVMYHSSEVYGDVEWPPMLRRDIYQIYRSSRHLLSMIDDILTLSRFEMTGFTLSYERTPMAEFLRETCEIARDLFRNPAVEFQIEIDPALPTLEIDHTRLRQVLLNLLNNACRFTERGHIRLESTVSRGDLVIRVSDTGSGIPAEKLPRVFDEFYQVDPSLHRKHGGAGLGLTISKRFIEAHGGTISVESVEGHGASFRIALPIPDPERGILRAATGVEPSETLRPAKPQLVIIDSNPRTAALVGRSFAAYQVIGVESLAALPGEARPAAVLRNVPLGPASPATEHGHGRFPLIECSLPSASWLSGLPGISACLEKPIQANILLAEMEHYPGVDDILVIDDEREFAILIERILQTTGRRYQIRRAYSGEQGLHEVSESAPGLILLDLIMPEMNGFRVLEQLQARPDWAQIPVILLTASSIIEDSLTQRSSQIVISQPGGFHPVEVLRCVSGILSALGAPRAEVG